MTRKLISRSVLIYPAAFLLLAAVAAPALATPVQVIECQTFITQGPLPYEEITGDFTIRRHLTHTTPVETTETSAWSQGAFQDNGTLEVTVYPIDGSPWKDQATSVQSSILDGRNGVRDDYLDEALSMAKMRSADGFTLDSVAIIMRKQAGDAVHTHTEMPWDWQLEDWDLNNCTNGCSLQCGVVWRVPDEPLPCASPNGTPGFCSTGSYLAFISSLSYEPHEADHDGGFAINAGLNDAWVNTAAPLQGLFVTVYEQLGLVFLAWFTYEAGSTAQTSAESVFSQATFGADDQRWVSAVGSIDGNRAELKAEMSSGGRFSSNEPVAMQDTDYGTITLEFDNCKNGHVTFDFPSAGQSGSFAIERVLNGNVAMCEALSQN